MTATILTFRPRLVDGSLVEVNRASLVAKMAQALIDAGSYHNERDAIMSLMWDRRFRVIDIAMLLDDARQVAEQHCIVARDMSQP